MRYICNSKEKHYTMSYRFPLTFALVLLASVAQALPANDLQSRMTQKALGLIAQMTSDEKINQLLNSAPAIERLNIPAYNWWNEALHGVARSGRATVFPEPIALAASFDTAMIYKVATAIGDEGRAKYNIAQKMGNLGQYAGLTYWSPNVNIFRDPRWGRGMETYGEDPYLTSRIGVAFVKGLQGNDPFYLKAAACAKHFAVHSGPEALRHEFNVDPSLKDLYETYLPAFEALVKEARVEAVMSAYNRVYGASATGSTLLLTDILRKQWGFTGHVVSDCDAVADIYQGHGLAKTAAEASVIALKSGLNLNCGSSFRALKQALDEKMITEADLDKALLPLMMTRLKLGILPGQEPTPYDNIPESVIASDQHAALAREAALKGMVLLKNDRNTLPVNKEIRTMYVTGPYATDVSVMLGNYYGVSSRLSTFLEGIVAKVSSGTSINYKIGFQSTVPNVNPIDWTTGEARSAEVCVIVMGLSSAMEGEEGEAISSPTKGDRISLALPQHQLEFLRKVRRNNRNKIVTVLTGGSPMDVKEIAELSDALILAWYPGQEGGLALGDLLFGDISPSGKLPVTFPVTADSLPAFEDYSMEGRTYKYMTHNIQYPFGYGLTYSKVEYSGVELIAPKNKSVQPYQVKVIIENTGKYAVEDVPQLYLTTPLAGVQTPLQSLIGFQRVALKPGEKKEVIFEVRPDQLQMVTEDGSKKLLKGVYRFTVSGAAPGKRTTELGVPSGSVMFTI